MRPSKSYMFLSKYRPCIFFQSIVFKTKKCTLCRPTRFVTPYGGQLVWMTPGNRPIIVHLKDKTKVRNKKRWSQIMYLYYLLTYKTSLTMKQSNSSNASNASKPFRELITPDCLRKVSSKVIDKKERKNFRHRTS
jgi:hypothetical protein